jgi:dolichyl-phosphate beta-glucosyltransferase
MKTGIIIPCYNEEKRLDQKAFVKFISENPNYHLCFVNDGSIDNTIDVLHQMRNEVPEGISIVDVKKNVGKASAVRAGVRYLYNRKEIAHIGFIDADLSTDFKDFKDLVKTLKSDKNLSVVFGSRNSGGGGIERDFFRNIMSKTVKAFILLIIGMPIRDTQCGAKVFSRNIVPVVYGEAFMSRWLFDVEIFLRLKNYLGSQSVMKHVREQPLMRWVHVDDSKLGLKDSLLIPAKLFHIWLSYNISHKINLIPSSYELEPTVEFYSNPNWTIAA